MRLAVATALLCLLAQPLPAAEPASDWEQAFPTALAPSNVYFRARYVDRSGNQHRLQVWRQADLRLRRQTDDAVELLAEKRPEGDYLYAVVDRGRHAIIKADRMTLQRSGRTVDWRGLAHVLERPTGEFRVISLGAAADADCRWQRLETAAGGGNEICWSERWGLPLEIRELPRGGTSPAWFSIEAIDTFEPDPAIFHLGGDGLLQIDAVEAEAAD